MACEDVVEAEGTRTRLLAILKAEEKSGSVKEGGPRRALQRGRGHGARAQQVRGRAGVQRAIAAKGAAINY